MYYEALRFIPGSYDLFFLVSLYDIYDWMIDIAVLCRPGLYLEHISVRANWLVAFLLL